MGHNKQDLTAHEAHLEPVSNLRQRIDELNVRAWKLIREDAILSRQLCEEAEALCSHGDLATHPYQYGYVSSLCTQAQLNLQAQQHDLALSQSLQALSLAETYEYRDLIPRALTSRGSIYFFLGNYSEALQTFYRQLELSQEIGDVMLEAQALMGIGVAHAHLGEHAKALEFYEISLKLFRRLNLPYWIALTLSNIAYSLSCLHQYDQALTHIEESLEVCQTHQVHERARLVALQNLADIYRALGRHTEALTQLKELITLAQIGRQPELEIDGLQALGDLYVHLQQFPEGIAALEKGLALAGQMGYRRAIYVAHEKMAQAFESTGDLMLALQHYRQFHQVKETVINEESSQKIKYLEVLHRTQTAQKEAALYASLYQQEQARRALAETLQQVAAALTSTLDLPQVLERILEQLAQIVAYDRASLLLKRGDSLEFVALRGFPSGHDLIRERIPLSASRPLDVFWQIYETKRPLALENLAQYDGWQQVGALSYPGAWLGVPLIRHDSVIGMLSLARETADPFTAESITLALTFATQAAVALENARLYDYTKRFSEQLEYEVRKRTEALRDAYEHLERLDRAKSDFITVTAHELRTPMTVVKGYSQLLSRDPAIVSDSQRHRLVMGIVSGADRLHEIVNTMLMMARIDSRELKLYTEPLLLSELFAELLGKLHPYIEERHQVVAVMDLLDLPVIHGDKELLQTVFSNILVNAIKYTPDKGTIRISGRAWVEAIHPEWPEDGLEIVISDTGIGIATESLQLIFTKFYQTGNVDLHSSGKTKFKAGGPGLGLAIARGIVEAHHGLLWAESAGHDEVNYPGSQFHIVLPRQFKHR